MQMRGKSKKSDNKGTGNKGTDNKGTGITYSYSYSDSIFLQRRQVENEWKKSENEWKKSENEWNDDEHEQRRIFDEKEKEKETFKCEITNKPKRPSTVDCNCEFGCMAKMSETFLIHYEGGVGIISKK
jgi:hypothetical protein